MEDKYKELIYRDKSQVPEHLLKYYHQRNRLFSQYDQGILLDEESWYSVTPELIAMQTAERCRCNVIVDAFCGVGGNAIAFAFTCEKVIAIDIDPIKIELAKHNAKIYCVDDRIEFINMNYIDWYNSYKRDYDIDIIFYSPPWGGIDYLDTFKLNNLKPVTGTELVKLAKSITPNVCMFLPRNTTIEEISELDERVEIEENWMSGKFKAITVYLGDFYN
ncbi:S-adenosyl-L-methionine-dependent methyltransferase [Wallemia mellicola]|nr:S-adenosyl-L-methionine-dependent methyltransferase [Wallemia mellicola]